MSLPALPMPKPTAQVAPFFDVLGPELTVQFLLQFGGAEMAFEHAPKGRGVVEMLVGTVKAKALSESRARYGQRRVPLAKRWLAQMLCWQGHSAADIARTLRVSDVSVRRWLKEAGR